MVSAWELLIRTSLRLNESFGAHTNADSAILSPLRRSRGVQCVARVFLPRSRRTYHTYFDGIRHGHQFQFDFYFWKSLRKKPTSSSCTEKTDKKWTNNDYFMPIPVQWCKGEWRVFRAINQTHTHTHTTHTHWHERILNLATEVTMYSMRPDGFYFILSVYHHVSLCHERGVDMCALYNALCIHIYGIHVCITLPSIAIHHRRGSWIQGVDAELVSLSHLFHIAVSQCVILSCRRWCAVHQLNAHTLSMVLRYTVCIFCISPSGPDTSEYYK